MHSMRRIIREREEICEKYHHDHRNVFGCISANLPGGSKEGDVIERCATCGEPVKVAKTVKAIGKLMPCSVDCRCIRAEEEEKSAEKMRKRLDDYAAAQAGIPERYRNAETSFSPEGASCYLYGPVRTGKTHTACAIGLKAIKAGMRVGFVSMAGIKRHEFSDGDGGLDYYEWLKSRDLLIIDDIGKSETSEWAVSLLYEVIDDRYNTSRDMIITSNYSLSELAKRLSATGAPNTASAIVRRIADVCKPYMLGTKVQA